MAGNEIIVYIRVRWWLTWYLHGVSLMSRLTGLPPNWGRVDKWIDRAIYFEWK